MLCDDTDGWQLQSKHTTYIDHVDLTSGFGAELDLECALEEAARSSGDEGNVRWIECKGYLPVVTRCAMRREKSWLSGSFCRKPQKPHRWHLCCWAAGGGSVPLAHSRSDPQRRTAVSHWVQEFQGFPSHQTLAHPHVNKPSQ